MAGQLGEDVRIEVGSPGGTRSAFLIERDGRPSQAVAVPFFAVCEGESLGCRVELLIDRDESADTGRVVVVELRAKRLPAGAAVSTTMLGRLPLKALTEQAVMQAGGPVFEPGQKFSYDATDALTLVNAKSQRGTLQIPDSDLHKVAKVARKAGRSRIAAVKETFGVSRPTAWRAIGRAEKAGHDIGGN